MNRLRAVGLSFGALAAFFVVAAAVPPASSGPTVPLDADTVDGFHASESAAPGTLLALDADGKFPASAIHQGPDSGLDADTLDGMSLDAIVAGALTDLECEGCVGTTDLEDGAVTGKKVPPFSINRGHLTFTPLVPADLEAHKASPDHDARYPTRAELGDPGALNDAGNPVTWSKLRDVPGGFADGVDDTGGTASDVVCTGCVDLSDLATDSIDGTKMQDDAVSLDHLANDSVNGDKIMDASVHSADLADASVDSSKIVDGSVSISDLAFDPATQTELDSHKVSADHDGRYFTKSQLQGAGTINASGNPVEWTKLKGVPAGLADGVDHGAMASAVIGSSGDVALHARNMDSSNVTSRLDGSGNELSGQVCIHGLAFTPRVAVGTADVFAEGGSAAFADRVVSTIVAPGIPTGCPDGTQVFAQIFDIGNGAFVNGSFNLVIEGE